MSHMDSCKSCGKNREEVSVLIPYRGLFLCDACVVEMNRRVLNDFDHAREEELDDMEIDGMEEDSEEFDEDIMSWSPLHHIDEDTIERILNNEGENFLVEYKDLNKEQIDPEAVALLPRSVAEQFCMIPLRKEGNSLMVAFSDPQDREALDEVRYFTGMDVSVVVADPEEIENAIEKYY